MIPNMLQARGLSVHQMTNGSSEMSNLTRLLVHKFGKAMDQFGRENTI